MPVTVGNEATLGALAHLDAAPDFVYATAEIGVGGGVVLGGRLYRGANGLAGELGHVVVDRDGRPCGCGGRGCLEQYAGKAALLADAGAVDLNGLAAALVAGEGRAMEAAASAGRALGVGLASVLNVLDVPVVVLGGIYAPLLGAIRPALRAELRVRALQPEAPRVVGSAHGTAAAARGAAAVVLDEVQRDPDRLTVVAD